MKNMLQFLEEKMATNLRKEKKQRNYNKSLKTTIKNIIKSSLKEGFSQEKESKFMKIAKKVFHKNKISRIQSRLKLATKKKGE